MKTMLKAQVKDGIQLLSVDSRHPINSAVPAIDHAVAFEATQIPVEIKEQIMALPTELNMYLSAVFELMLYTKKDFMDVVNLMKLELPVKRAWKTIQPNPDDQASLNSFYSQTDAFIYDGMANHAAPPTMATLGEVARICLHFSLKEVLDWGAGVGTLTILLNRYGIPATHVDLPGKTLEFSRWRYQLRRMNVNVIPLPHRFAPESVDGIVCLEVVEHVKDLQDMLKIFYRILKPGAILLCSESFGQLQYASHLKANAVFSGDRFADELKQIGFELLPEFSQFYINTYQKI